MRSVRRGLLAGALILSAGMVVGCRNRVAEERDALHRQTQELDRLKEESDRRNEELARQNAELRAQMEANKRAPQAPAPAPAPAAPAPEKPPVTEVGGAEAFEDKIANTVTVNLPSDVFFTSGAANISAPGRSSLDKVAAALKKDYAGKAVRVEGHTDSDPIKKSKWGTNQALSEARAKAVMDYLATKGISNMTTVGHGSEKPRGQDKARNRRVEIVVLDVSAAAAPKPAAAAPAKVDRPEQNK